MRPVESHSDDTIHTDWQTVGSSPEDKVVKTKIDDGSGVRNIQRLRRRGNLWWTPDGAMYVYYTPTHWASV